MRLLRDLGREWHFRAHTPILRADGAAVPARNAGAVGPVRDQNPGQGAVYGENIQSLHIGRGMISVRCSADVKTRGFELRHGLDRVLETCHERE